MRLLLSFILFLTTTCAYSLTWFNGTRPVSFTINGKHSPVVDIAADMFRGDIIALTGMEAVRSADGIVQVYQLDKASTNSMKRLRKLNVLSSDLQNNSDAFFLGVRNGKIIVVGNNGRGTAYGLLELSRISGVSPWIWWGDVIPERKQTLTIDDTFETVQSPSVEYRGIFINDEDWSTRRWAHKTVEPELPNGCIGPATYKHIFQLLLRLKANTIWPAMHEGTTAFFSVKGNKEIADSCGIVVGSSHCEPILRNNVGEWDKSVRGDYNFITNRESVATYWAERLEEMRGNDALFTIGMRGIHDGSMEGVKTAEEKFNGLQSVIDCQRELIAKHYSKDVEKVPQVFIPYKEVLEIYEQGLKVPEDVTLMWCDDNYGYMTRLSDAEQQKRIGGGGVYYHLSYWGRPHDYLWLTTTQPGLVYNELRQAYDHNARRIWIINVHDVKVAAYQLSLAMDMAWNINAIDGSSIRKHLLAWLTEQLGTKTAKAIMPAMEKFYKLTAIRRPEFMGWTQVELDKKRYPGGKSLPLGTEFSPTEFGGEMQKYLAEYDAIVEAIKLQGRNDDTFFAHITYPIECAAAMAHKHLDAQRGDTLAAMKAQEHIKALTNHYNEIANGKWNGLMDCQPRLLPVFADYTSAVSNSSNDNDSAKVPFKTTDNGFFITRNAIDYTSCSGNVCKVEMLGHSQNAVSIPKGCSVGYDIEITEPISVLRTALIPTQANDKGDIRYSISIDGGTPIVKSLKEPYRSEQWKRNVLRNQALQTTSVALAPGKHILTITALDDHIILDQWMLDSTKDRKFYVIPVGK